MRERILSRLQVLSAEPDVGARSLDPETMTWAETRSPTLNRLSHPVPYDANL